MKWGPDARCSVVRVKQVTGKAQDPKDFHKGKKLGPSGKQQEISINGKKGKAKLVAESLVERDAADGQKWGGYKSKKGSSDELKKAPQSPVGQRHGTG